MNLKKLQITGVFYFILFYGHGLFAGMAQNYMKLLN